MGRQGTHCLISRKTQAIPAHINIETNSIKQQYEALWQN
jgi:hypothetical protein